MAMLGKIAVVVDCTANGAEDPRSLSRRGKTRISDDAPSPETPDFREFADQRRRSLERFPAGLNSRRSERAGTGDFLGCAESEAARDGALVGGFAQAGGFGGSRGRHELPGGGAAVRGEFSSAIRWVAALRERGSYAPLPMGGDTRSQRVEAHADFLLRLHRREPDLTLNEICDRLERARGEKVSPSMIWRFFDRHDITLKKSAHASEQGRPDVLERRRRWFECQLDSIR